MAYHSSVGCDLGGDQPTGYATSSTCFHTPEITITRQKENISKNQTVKTKARLATDRRHGFTLSIQDNMTTVKNAKFSKSKNVPI